MPNRPGAAYIYDRDEGGPDNWGEVAKLTDPTGNDDDYFGYTVSISNDTAVVGAHKDTSSAGSAFVYDRDEGGPDNWGEVKKLTGATASSGDYFGYSVSISGDVVIVGVRNDDGATQQNSGSAQIFYRDQFGANQWGIVRVLRASDETAFDHFGSSVCFSGNYVIVGAPDADESSASNTGAAYLFEGSPPQFEQLDRAEEIRAGRTGIG